MAEAKYLDHGPLARQERQMRRQGLDITRQALWDQLFALYRHLAPTADALHAYVLSSDLILGDETRWPLLGREDTSRWHAWGVAREDAISILGSRGLESACAVLAGFQGTLVVDGYAVYEAVKRSRAGPEIALAHCWSHTRRKYRWSHTRRKYREAEPHHPRAGAMLDMIGELYAIEARAREVDVKERLAVLGELRRTESRPIVDDIGRWVTTEHALPKSSLGKALAYTEPRGSADNYEAHHGEIGFDSGAQGGSTFWFRLPPGRFPVICHLPLEGSRSFVTFCHLACRALGMISFT